ncbi:MAG TPA: 3-phosphoshikimate 1-carboxyvinyltransferase [Candidatus Limnocylindrales bacterium]|nr:3-phosphoshikimate 1-carboxyvinyltransferase [Candidatus Limnocylindrales bacterium]
MPTRQADPAAVPDAAVVAQATRLRGRLRMPPDKSISHRALLLAAVAAGTSRISGASRGADVEATASCLAALGVPLVRSAGADGARSDWTVESPGWAGWRGPRGDLDCANSGTTMRLLAGLLAGSALATPVRLTGDASLQRRPMERVVAPLAAMGAEARAEGEGGRPPLTLAGRRPLRALDWTTAVPSAQVKSSIVLAGLAGEGRTIVREAVATRDHTERMLRARGVRVAAEQDERTGGWAVALDGGQPVASRDEEVPGDISAAAFWLVAGAAHPDAVLTLEGVGVNPSRAAVIELLTAMGAAIEVVSSAGAGEPDPSDGAGAQDPSVAAGEPTADLIVRSSPLEGIEIGPREVARAIDEIPILCLAAACARGTTRIRGAGELRHKESDRLTAIVTGLAALGARIEVEGDDLTIEGRRDRLGCGLAGAEVASLGDHRLAMAFAVAGLIAAGRTVIGGAGSVGVSYPGFFDHLEGVRA